MTRRQRRDEIRLKIERDTSVFSDVFIMIKIMIEHAGE